MVDSGVTLRARSITRRTWLYRTPGASAPAGSETSDAARGGAEASSLTRDALQAYGHARRGGCVVVDVDRAVTSRDRGAPEPRRPPTRSRSEELVAEYRPSSAYYEPAQELVTDTELLATAVAGDPQAFNVLFSRHRDRLWAIAAEILRHQHDADDAVQAALVRAWRHAGKFRGDSSVFVWLRTITINVSTTMAVQRAKLAARVVEEERASEVTDQAAADVTSSAEINEVLRQALIELPASHRTAFVLVTLLQMSVAEVAELQAVRPGTVKSRVRRARQKLTEQVGFREVINLLRGTSE